MLAIFSIRLHADAPELNRRRAYRVEVGCDLFGDWQVEISFRIGAAGRSLRYPAADEDQARRLGRACLYRRASTPRRLGVAYAELGRYDPAGWGLEAHTSASPHLRTSAPLHLHTSTTFGASEAIAPAPLTPR